ncbi:hypothetical protein [Pedobacter chitinilyticus]|nr:hypothetical protein [Pedobacter chitinilyticus]
MLELCLVLSPAFRKINWYGDNADREGKVVISTAAQRVEKSLYNVN